MATSDIKKGPLYVDSTNNRVGIGTASPNKSSSSTALTVDAPAVANYAALELSSGETLNWYVNANNAAVYDVTAGTRDRIFFTNGVERLRIEGSSGSVGVGTASPAATLESKTSTSGAPATSGTTPANVALRLSSTATTGLIDIGMNGASPFIQATDSGDLSQKYNLALNPNGGNVGIGQSNPTYLLKVGPVNTTETIAVQSTGGGAETIMQSVSGSDSRIGSSANTPLNLITNNVSRMTIDTSGRVTMPYQPSFAVTRNQGSISNAVYIYSSAFHNTGGHYNSSNGRFTAPVTGSYFIATNHMNDNTGTQNNVQYAIRVNGGTYQLVYSSSSINVHMRWSWAGVIYLNQGDYIDILVSSGLNLYGNSNLYTQFSGYLLG